MEMKTEVKDTTKAEPLLLSVKDVCGLLGIGVTHFYSLLSSGQVGPRPIKLGRRVLFRREEIEAWVAAGCPCLNKWG